MTPASSPSVETAIAWRETQMPERPVVACFERLRPGGHGWLLDSALATSALSRASFLGADPYAVARIRRGRLRVDVRRDADPRLPLGRHAFDGDPLDALREILPPRPHGAPPPFDFCGGAVGYLGYELAECLDVHRLHGRDDLGLADAVLLLVDRVLVVDPDARRAFVCGLGFGADRESARRAAGHARDALEAASQRDAPPAALPEPDAMPPRARADAPDEPIDPAAYAKAVDAIQQEIAAGNVYQACLTARARRAFAGCPWQLFRALRRHDPAPFACFLELPELAVVGASPERFLRVGRDGAVESRPIKGTAARGRDPLADARQREALRRSEKDRAENLMIVDLVRNDLGRVCATGSVHAPALMAVEAYAGVFQLVSTVRGRLAAGRDALDAVRATFPPGSMTGAPKIAAMALLDRLEPVRRTVYSGAIGYLDAFGGCDLSVVIRTALLKDGQAFLHAGGGIVADSKPFEEYREALSKLAPLERALDEVRRAAIGSTAPRPDERRRTGWAPFPE